MHVANEQDLAFREIGRLTIALQQEDMRQQTMIEAFAKDVESSLKEHERLREALNESREARGEQQVLIENTVASIEKIRQALALMQTTNVPAKKRREHLRSIDYNLAVIVRSLGAKIDLPF